MKKRYFLLIVFCFLMKNIAEYTYTGDDQTDFYEKWIAFTHNASESIIVTFDSSFAKEANIYASRAPLAYVKDMSLAATNNNEVGSGSYNIGSNMQSGIATNATDVLVKATSYNVQVPSAGLSLNPYETIFSNVTNNGSINWSGNDVGVTGLPGGPTAPPIDNSVPIDGGLSILLAAAVGKGIKSYKTKAKGAEKMICSCI